jgi:hypothetical protein
MQRWRKEVKTPPTCERSRSWSNILPLREQRSCGVSAVQCSAVRRANVYIVYMLMCRDHVLYDRDRAIRIVVALLSAYIPLSYFAHTSCSADLILKSLMALYHQPPRPRSRSPRHCRRRPILPLHMRACHRSRHHSPQPQPPQHGKQVWRDCRLHAYIAAYQLLTSAP